MIGFVVVLVVVFAASVAMAQGQATAATGVAGEWLAATGGGGIVATAVAAVLYQRFSKPANGNSSAKQRELIRDSVAAAASEIQSSCRQDPCGYTEESRRVQTETRDAVQESKRLQQEIRDLTRDSHGVLARLEDFEKEKLRYMALRAKEGD